MHLSTAAKPLGRVSTAASTPDHPVLPPRIRPTPATWAVLAIVAALLTLNWLCAVARFQVNLLNGDQWDYLNPLFRGDGWWALFSHQHGPHRQGLGFVLTSWVMAASDWDSRIESLWIIVILIASAALTLRLKWTLTGALRASDAWILLIVLSLAQVETVIITPNASHSVFPLLLLIVAGNLWLTPHVALRYVSAGGCAIALLFTGFGLFGGLVLTVLLAAAGVRAGAAGRGREAAWATAGLAFAVAGLIAFAHDYTFQPATEGFRFPWSPWTDYFRFVLLMLAFPGGVPGSSPFALLGGSLVFILALGLSLHLVAQWWRARSEPLTVGVQLLLLGAGLAFAFNAAVGRVHLGVDAGMVSRYVTLLAPITLGFGLWAATQSGGWQRRLLLGVVWAMALGPFVELGRRPIADWPGTAGLASSVRLALAESAEIKQLWATTYLKTGDWGQADAISRSNVHPQTVATQLEVKLAWLQARGLSFFAPAAGGQAYFPWWDSERAVWLHAYPSDNATRWMAHAATLVVYTKEPAYVNVMVLTKESSLPPDAPLRFVHLGAVATWSVNDGTPPQSLPVPAGLTAIVFESAAGVARPMAGPGGSLDSRELSFQLAQPTLSRRPQGSWWALDPVADEWRHLRGWRPVSGFHQWEDDGRFIWTRESAVLEVTTLTSPAFLNVHVQRRYPAVDRGLVIVTVDGRNASLEIPSGRGSGFSLPLLPRDQPYRITVRNTAGEQSPAELGLSSDPRPLALKIDRLTVDEEPVYPQLLRGEQ